jgi:Zn-dependent M28 family amino/carboxypeptidase
VINLDLVGSGSEGIKVVNGTVFQNAFQQLKEINSYHHLLVDVRARGEAANSDHYPFYTAGVKSFFIYTLGDESGEYHTINDLPQNVPYTVYNQLFTLLTLFIANL